MAGRRSKTAWVGAFVLAVPLAASLIGGSTDGAPIASATPIMVRPVASVGINTSDRAAVRSALVQRLRPALLTPIGWTGSTSACRAGAPSAKAQASTLVAINYFRAMGRLDPVTFDSAMSARAQKAALMMDANFSLDHSPPRSWNCWTQAGADAAGQSNLCLGCSGARAIEAYMSDLGANNGVVGHRRWVMFPQTTRMGSGSTRSANALMVFGSAAAPSTNLPTWVSWPTPEYFPTQLEPGGRWSLSASDSAVEFGAAKVAVTTATGTKLRVKQETIANGYGSNTLVWQISGMKLPTGTTPRRIDVAVTGIRSGNTVLSRRYSVRLFNADAPLTNTTAPRISGTASAGHTLTVKAGTWSPTATSYGYVWYRGSTPIAGVTGATYTLRTVDVGKKISVRVIAVRAGYASGAHRTPTRIISSG